MAGEIYDKATLILIHGAVSPQSELQGGRNFFPVSLATGIGSSRVRVIRARGLQRKRGSLSRR